MYKTLIISGLCAFTAFAQTTTKIVAEHSGPMGISAVLAGPAATIPGAPYSAQAVTQHEQILIDGNIIRQTTTNAVARDSKGRVYREESLPASADSFSGSPHLVTIDDPVAGIHLSLNSSTKTAYKIPASDQKKSDEAAFTVLRLSESGPAANPTTTLRITTDHQPLEESAKDSTTTDLGTQLIEGIPAKGTKYTRTIPAGTIGNDAPILITTETWFSPDLKILLLTKSNDPRVGETTYKLTNLSRAEPSPSLFQIPSDYTVKDQPHNLIFVTKQDK